MSKVKIQGNSSGTGVFTIEAPNSNTDRTLTLPDNAGEVLTNTSSLPAGNLTGTLPSIDGSNLTGISSFAYPDNLPAGAIVKTVSKIDGGFYTISATSYTEITTNYRINFTPSYSNSLIILDWTGLVGGNNTGNIKNAKWWDITSNTDIPSQPNPTGRTLAHGSWRHVDLDGNDRENMTMKAYFPSWGTTEKTFGVLAKTESVSGFFGATSTNNSGCTYIPSVITVTEIKQ